MKTCLVLVGILLLSACNSKPLPPAPKRNYEQEVTDKAKAMNLECTITYDHDKNTSIPWFVQCWPRHPDVKDPLEKIRLIIMDPSWYAGGDTREKVFKELDENLDGSPQNNGAGYNSRQEIGKIN